MAAQNIGVMINGKHTLNDWDLHWSNVEISEPVPITSYVNIPGRSTKLDATEALFGGITYEHRTIKMSFWAKTSYAQWLDKTTRIQTAIGGKWCKIILDIEADKYWMGRVTVSSSMDSENPVLSFYTITAEVEPYKYWSSDAWMWDPFNLQTGRIENLNDFAVNGSRSILIRAKEIPATPTVTATTPMTLTYKGKDYRLTENEPLIMHDVVIYKDQAIFNVIGTGKISVTFRGETL